MTAMKITVNGRELSAEEANVVSALIRDASRSIVQGPYTIMLRSILEGPSVPPPLPMPDPLPGMIVLDDSGALWEVVTCFPPTKPGNPRRVQGPEGWRLWTPEEIRMVRTLDRVLWRAP